MSYHPQTLDVIEANKTQAVNLTAVHVTGGEHFSDNFFNKLLAPLLSSADLTVDQLVKKCDISLKNFLYTNCFDDVSVSVEQVPQTADVARSAAIVGPPISLTTKIQLLPKQLSHLTLGSTHTKEGNTLLFNYSNLNTFGNAEYLQVTAADSLVPESQGKLLSFIYKAPMVNTSLKLFTQGLISRASDLNYQSEQQWVTSGLFGIEKESIFKPCCCNAPAKASYLAGISLVKRTTLQVNDSANDEIKTYAGDHFKEALLLNASLNCLSYLPASQGRLALNGFHLQLKNELTGFSNINENKKNDEKFYKGEATVQYVKSIFQNGLTLDCQLGLGHLLNLSQSSKTIHYQDKFYVDVAGYKKLGLSSPKTVATDNSVTDPKIGGLSYLSFDFKLLSRFLLVNPKNPLRLYLGWNGGELLNSSEGLLNGLIELGKSWKSVKSGCNVGLTYKVGNVADCDLYYKLPVSGSGETKPGFGLSVSLFGDY